VTLINRQSEKSRRKYNAHFRSLLITQFYASQDIKKTFGKNNIIN